MPDDRAQLEEAANAENAWVRACILKREPPVEGSLLKITQRARDMAANSLGLDHPSYAVALQNLGLYYEIVEQRQAEADTLYAQARTIVGDEDLPLAYGIHCLGLYYGEIAGDEARAQSLFAEAEAIHTRWMERLAEQ